MAMKKIYSWGSSILLGLSLFSACTTRKTPVDIDSQPAALPSASTPSKTVPSLEIPTITILSVEKATIQATDLEPLPAVELCSPIEGMPRQELENSVVTPFLPPLPGSDDPHHGVDLADIDPDSGFALEGRRVNALMGGKVAGVILNRFPYGNGIILEAPLRNIAAGWVDSLDLPVIQPVDLSASPLTCPSMMPPAVSAEMSGRSLYFLYAHLKDPLAYEPGEWVTCGQQLGNIGSTGNSINPHLHLEVRVGMENIPLGSMAHYDASATIDEMNTYCLWRISGYFQRIDPMKLISYIRD